MKPLSRDKSFKDYAFLVLNRDGQFVGEDRKAVPVAGLKRFFDHRMNIGPQTTDVFVWIHGWQNNKGDAQSNSETLFPAILDVFRKKQQLYPRIKNFNPRFVTVHWPSSSRLGRGGYRRIRDLAAKMTNQGEAEYFLARLLGYLEDQNKEAPRENRKVLAARGGFFVHCIGHSFGGRFLTAAVRASSDPTPRTKLLSENRKEFPYTVDTFLIFQMAAPAISFQKELQTLAKDAPIADGNGRIVLTFSTYDAANCGWHEWMEGEEAIGCRGAAEPSALISTCEFRKLARSSPEYPEADFATRIVNVDASSAFTKGSQWGSGAHSDYWYEDSVHLILTQADRARR